MESKNNSRGVDSTTIDNFVSELEQMERRKGRKPTVGVTGEWAREIISELRDRGYDCGREGEYTISANQDNLAKIKNPTNHYPQRTIYLPQGI